MSYLQFRQKSTAHQILLLNRRPVLEVNQITRHNDQIKVLFLDVNFDQQIFNIPQQIFVTAINNNELAVFLNCEFKKEARQFVLASREMAESLGLEPVKELTKVSRCQTNLSYESSVMLANSVKYKNLVERKALSFDWQCYEHLQKFQSIRYLTFHSQYSSHFNHNRQTVRELESEFIQAYETFNFEQLERAIDRVESITALLPLLFVQALKRCYLEIVRNWILVNADIPCRFTSRPIQMINSSHLPPFYLKPDAGWMQIKNALDYFVLPNNLFNLSGQLDR